MNMTESGGGWVKSSEGLPKRPTPSLNFYDREIKSLGCPEK